MSFDYAQLLAAAVASCAIGASAAAPQVEAPEPGFLQQPGRDVPFIATPQAVVEKMLDMAKVTAKDYVIDLGSGDGRIVIAAAKRGARALGIESVRDLVELSRRKAQQEGVGDRAEFLRQDLFETDLSRATVVTMFLGSDINLKLRPKLLRLAPGTRIVSNVYGMGDWVADEMGAVDANHGCDTSWCAALLWIVPAQVAGTHEIPQGELVLEQSYQMLSGRLRTEGNTVPVEGQVIGQRVVLTAEGRQLRGRIEGKRLVLD